MPQSLPTLLGASSIRGASACLTLAFLVTLAGVSSAGADEPTSPPPALPRATEPAPRNLGDAPSDLARPTARVFATPALAAKCLFDALEANDDATLHAMTGPGAEDLVLDGNDPEVRRERAALAAAAKTRLELVPGEGGRIVPVVGPSAYPLAIHFTPRDGTWCVDAEACRREMTARRIGEQELEAIGICLAYADAQVAYAAQDRNEDGVKEYAQRLVSTPGARDGLSWESAADEAASPAGPGLAELRAPSDGKAPTEGYSWRVLTAQGANVPGGAYSYIINGRMIAGFALLGVPAVHRSTGVKSFMVSHNGRIYEKDLGADTQKQAAAIQSFDLDASWHEVDEATLAAASDPTLDTANVRDEAGMQPTDAPERAAPVAPGSSPVPCPPLR